MRATLLLLTVVWTAGCARPSANRPLTRAYWLGFAAAPPRLELASVLQTIEQWTRHGDAALLLLQPPWRSLLADTSAAFLVRRDQRQGRWMDRQMELADPAQGVAVFQITFTDPRSVDVSGSPWVDSASLRATRTSRHAVSTQVGARQMGSRLGATGAPLTTGTFTPV